MKRDLRNKNKLTTVNSVSKTVEVNFLNMQQGLEEKSSLYFVVRFQLIELHSFRVSSLSLLPCV